MADENDETADPKTTASVLVPKPTDIEQLRLGYRNLQVRVSDLERNLDNARREVSEARWSVRLLRNATTDLLAPIMLVGSACFLFGWIEADSWWDYALICGAGIFGFHWFRDVGRNFDEVTKTP